VPRVHHVNVVVPPGATDECVRFYCDVLGLTRIAKPSSLRPDGAWLAIDAATQLHLSERDGAAHPSAHFALVIDDFEAMHERVMAAGAEWGDAEDIFHGGRAFTRDPAGNRIELLERAGDLA
jgi:catechol 2,3-dioxygenase-like lactoylglutathione lyase family enzyme